MSHKLTGLPAGVCAYYNAPGGCSRGERCSFKHQGQEGVGLKERPQIPPSALAETSSSSKKKPSQSTTATRPASANTAAAVGSSSDSTPRPSTAVSTKKYVNAQFFSHPTSDPAPPIVTPGDAIGSWTRGTPFLPKPTFVPKPLKALLQLSTSAMSDMSQADTHQIDSVSRNTDSTAWNVAGQSKVKLKSSDATTSTRANGQQERGILNVPAGLLQANSKSSKPSQPQPQQTKSFKPKPKASWSITDRLDLSSLSKLDAITAARPLSASTTNITSLSSFPPLSSAAAWATSAGKPSQSKSNVAIANANQAKLNGVSTSSIAPVSVLKSSRSASHKPSSTVSFASALVSGPSSNSKTSNNNPAAAATTTTLRRSASAKSAQAKKKTKSSTASKAPVPQKPHKQTQLKKALIRERMENWIRTEVIEPLIWKAVGLEMPVTQPLLPETIPEREKALSELKKKLKFEAYQRKLEEIERNRQEKKNKKLEEKIARERKEDASKSQDIADASVEILKEDSTGAVISSASNIIPPDAMQVEENATNTAEGNQLPEENPTISSSDGGEDDIESETESSESEIEESKRCQKFSDEEAELAVGEAADDTRTDEADDEDQVELIPAEATPSTHAIGYFPSASPPSASSSIGPASESLYNPLSGGGIRTLFNRSIPSSYQLSAAEQALLNWHFQFKHHGAQPKLEGACKRHCKQMWKSSIDQIVFSMVRDLHVHDQRSKEKEKLHSKKDGPAKAVKQRLVSGLKQCFKMLRVNRIKCVIVAAHIEANASAGGLDDLLDDILALCDEQRVPVVYALDREKLGTAIQTTNASSAVGILDYSTVGDSYRSLLSLVRAAQEEWGMFQEDAWLNPRPANWMDSYAKDIELMRIKKEERERKKKTHSEAVNKAEAKRKEMQLALRMEKAAKKGIDASLAKKKSHGGRNSDRRELLPLPVLTEEQMKKKHRRRKGQHKTTEESKASAAPTAASAPSSSASSSATSTPVIPVKGQSTASALKGAGKALAAIAEAVQEDKPAPSSTSEKGKRGKSGKKEDQKSKKKGRK